MQRGRLNVATCVKELLLDPRDPIADPMHAYALVRSSSVFVRSSSDLIYTLHRRVLACQLAASCSIANMLCGSDWEWMALRPCRSASFQARRTSSHLWWPTSAKTSTPGRLLKALGEWCLVSLLDSFPSHHVSILAEKHEYV